jgi:hypothetical protein
MAPHKPNIRDMYRQSAERVKLALELLGSQSAADAPRVPPDGDLATVARLMHELSQSHSAEPESDYRSILVSVAAWSAGVADKSFFLENLVAKPHVAFVLRKGLEVLHLMLHRDLRRRALSSSESQIYYDFVRLTSGMRPPPKLSRDRPAQGQS